MNTRYIIQGGDSCVEKTRDSSCLPKGTSSYLRFVHQLESQIQNLKERIEVLENRSKKLYK